MTPKPLLSLLDRLIKERAALHDDPKFGPDSKRYRELTRQIEELKAERKAKQAAQ